MKFRTNKIFTGRTNDFLSHIKKSSYTLFSKLHNIFNKEGVSYDPDAILWFTANNVTDPTQKNAYNNFILGLKDDSLWSKIYQGLPLAFNDATMNSVDMKLAFNATMYGGITHASGYVQGDGVNGYIDMNISPLNDLQQDNVGVTFYRYSAAANNVIDAGSYVNFDTYFWMHVRDNFDNLTLYLNDDAGGTAQTANADGVGLYTFNRSSSTAKQVYKNGSSIASLTRTSKTPPNVSLNLMRINPLASYSSAQFGMWFVHESFDATEIANFHARISTLQSDLGI